MNNKLKFYSDPVIIIPKQRLPGFIRWPLRVLAYPVMMMDIGAQQFVRLFFRSRYVLEGSCKKRGACCQFIHMGWPKKGKMSLVSKLYIFWQTEVLGFYFRGFDLVEDDEITKVMSCRYLKADGQCAHYRLRPGICRNWPKVHIFKEPTLLKGCGYRTVLRKKEKVKG